MRPRYAVCSSAISPEFDHRDKFLLFHELREESEETRIFGIVKVHGGYESDTDVS